MISDFTVCTTLYKQLKAKIFLYIHSLIILFYLSLIMKIIYLLLI